MKRDAGNDTFLNFIASSCFEKTYAICELNPNVHWAPMMIDDLSLLIVSGVYVHPMNSISSCLAYCNGQSNVNYVVIDDKTCICTESIDQFHNMPIVNTGLDDLSTSVTIASCDHYIPCPGIPTQQCGCMHQVNQTGTYPLVSKFNGKDKLA